MWRSPACAAAGLSLAFAAAFALTPTISEAFAPAKSLKGDRLPVKDAAPAGAFALSFTLPGLNTTVVAKNPKGPTVVTSVSYPRTRPVQAVRPAEEPAIAQKPKLPEGCEPPFSPVTVPAMAHVASRCTS
jgi:hypothetical protein